MLTCCCRPTLAWDSLAVESTLDPFLECFDNGCRTILSTPKLVWSVWKPSSRKNLPSEREPDPLTLFESLEDETEAKQRRKHASYVRSLSVAFS